MTAAPPPTLARTLVLRPAHRLFFDTEFYEDGTTVDLISIGMVNEAGREFYAVNADAQLHRVSPWVRANVLAKLPPYSDPAWMSYAQIQFQLTAFLQSIRTDLPFELWAYFADYDWVALCQLFGTMVSLPSMLPKMCMDLKQLSIHLGFSSEDHPKQTEGHHDALADARWNRDLFRFLTKAQP